MDIIYSEGIIVDPVELFVTMETNFLVKKEWVTFIILLCTQ